ncbi:hypothetical protein AYI70_g6321 [Smittium culicis]|uniref:Uncharacterized protein n=1 Tax=Smittium culicis TaxID=133412 RepID=A0A1R1XQG4_9FUNG|nr:hypothetical protein AYI70_g6321 [Smittium culicis]
MGNLVSMATHSRLDNLHSGMSFIGKPEQVEESDVKPLMDSEKFEIQLAAIKPTKRARARSPFRGRQQIEGRPSPFSSSTATAPITEAAATRSAAIASRGGFQKGARSRGRGSQKWLQPLFQHERFDEESAAPPKRYPDRSATTNIASSAIQAEAQPRGSPDPDGGGGIPTNKEGHRGGGESEPRILQQFILHSKEDGRDTICIGSKEAEPASRGKELQDGIPAINLKDNQEKGLYDVPGFEGHIPEYSNQEVVQKILALLL